jgi:hypothetical protein
MVSFEELAKESKKHFAVGEFKEASLLLKQIREADPWGKYFQDGDGTIVKVGGADKAAE